MLHYNSAKYANVKEAFAAHDGLATIGIVYKESPVNNPRLNQIIEIVKEYDYLYTNESVPMPRQIMLSDFLPQNNQFWFNYFGSRDKPECEEGINWFIPGKIENIGTEQVSKN